MSSIGTAPSVVQTTRPTSLLSQTFASDARRSQFSFTGLYPLFEDIPTNQNPPPYTPTAPSPIETSPPCSPQSTSSRRVRPQRCKAGTLCIGFGECGDVEQKQRWKSQFVQLRDGKMFVTSSRENKDDQVVISLKSRFLSMPRKRVIVIHGGPSNVLIKCSTEIQANQWTMALSQYCYIAPIMEGFCEKLSLGKNVFQERFLRLCSDGVLSWYKTESEESEPRGAVQLRGVECWLDYADSKIIHVQVEPRGYQFRFHSQREAELWLAAFQWHFGRKLLRRASVPLRNKAK